MGLAGVVAAGLCVLPAPPAFASGGPTNTVLPALSGTPDVGNTLTTTIGTWSGTGKITYTYKWEDCTSSSETACTTIAGATSSTYLLKSSDGGLWIAAVVTASNSKGSTSASSRADLVYSASSYEGQIAQNHPTAFWQLNDPGPPTVADSSSFGNNGTYSSNVTILNLNQPGFDGNPTFGVSGDASMYAQVPGSVFANAGPASVQLWFRTPGTAEMILSRESTVGSWAFIYNPVFYVDSAGYLAGTLWWDGDHSGPNGDPLVVKSLNPVNDGHWHEAVITVDSSGTEALTLDGVQQSTIALGAASQNPPNATIGAGDFGYGWSDLPQGWTGFTGQISDVAVYNYLLSPSQMQLPAIAPKSEAAPAITGQATSGQTLTASPGVWGGVPAPSYGYQWLDCNTAGTGCVPIAGATTVTYTAQSSDIGSTLEVKVTASNASGSASASSSPSAAVRDADQALASKFEPILNFSSQEKWRPLNVDAFFAENFGSSGRYGPYNQICDPTSGMTICSDITSASQLTQYASTADYIEFDNTAPAGNIAQPDNYVTPTSSCLVGVLLDCDSGSASSIYYTIAGPSAPGGLYYIEYFFFYRYNQGYQDIGNHVGDWEGVTIAPTTDDRGIAFVELSHHGEWDSYLVSAVTCGTSSLACSIAGAENSNVNVDDFPASGSHANYPGANTGGSTDGNTDGAATWGNDLNPSYITEIPAAYNGSWTNGPENWTDWPGAWGDTPQSSTTGFSGSPCGPGAQSGVAADGYCGPDHSNHYFVPWGTSNNGNVCSTGPCPDLRSSARTASTSCGSWAGGGVAASVCEPHELASKVGSALFNSQKASFRVWIAGTDKTAATAPGLAQLIGPPLHAGQAVIISGHVLAGAKVVIQAERGKRLYVERVTVTRAFRRTVQLRIRAARGGRVEMVATRGVRDLGRVTSTLIPPGS